MGGATEVWTKFGIQILVLLSLVFQLLLFVIPILRRHKLLVQSRYVSAFNRFLLWLAYQLADTTAIYVLGHMAFSTSTSREDKQLLALWAALLLVHLGGQDTITAYALEDNRLWMRHLLTLLVQAAGVVYVLPAHGGRDLRAASALMFIVGFLKIVERVWVLQSSSDIGKFAGLLPPRVIPLTTPDYRTYTREEQLVFDPEEDLKQAHHLLSFCLGQFIDDRDDRLSQYQKSIILWYLDHNKLYELVELQLSLVHDKLYTKAAAIHTWHGCLIRAFSWLATVIASTLFLSRSGSTKPYSSLDAIVTYALLAGAFLLETASLFKAAGSTWTCQILHSRGWHGLHSVVLSLRQLVKAAERSRRWPAIVGGYSTLVQDPRELIRNGHIRQACYHAIDLYSLKIGLVSETTKELVLEHIRNTLEGCHGDEEKLRNYRGELSLQRLSTSDAPLMPQDIKASVTETAFDESILIWRYATERCTTKFLLKNTGDRTREEMQLLKAISVLCSYMMYLFTKQTHMLPPPVRHSLYKDAHDRWKWRSERSGGVQVHGSWLSPTHGRGHQIHEYLMERALTDKVLVLKVILGVWVEMMCYSASYCNRDSHARELSNGSGEFSTVVWIVRTALVVSQRADPRQQAIEALSNISLSNIFNF